MAKLFASVRNEKKVIKGVGGAEYLDIDIMVGNSLIGAFTLRRTDELPEEEESSGWCLYDATDGNDEPIHWIPDKKKGQTTQGE